MNAQTGTPQHLGDRGGWDRTDELPYWIVLVRDRPDLPCGDGDGQPDGLCVVGVVGEGVGKAAKISESEPEPEPLPALSFASLSFAFNRSSIPMRLAVLPRSRFEASFVARLMSSGRLVALPLPIPCADASKLRRGGRLKPLSLIAGSGEAVPLEARAPPFSRWPRIWFTLGSIGDPVGDGSPKYRLLAPNGGIGDELRGESRKLASLS